MENKQFFVSIVNINTRKVFALPTLYTDRTEACICGQNYVRDRQQENSDELFFRVLIAKNGTVHAPYKIYDDDDDDCVGSCECCGLCREEENEAEFDDEEDSPFYLTDEQAEKLAGFLLGLN